MMALIANNKQQLTKTQTPDTSLTVCPNKAIRIPAKLHKIAKGKMPLTADRKSLSDKLNPVLLINNTKNKNPKVRPRKGTKMAFNAGNTSVASIP